MEAYRASNGHCNVSNRADIGLSKWVSEQRKSLKRGTLKLERAARLGAVGVLMQRTASSPKNDATVSEMEGRSRSKSVAMTSVPAVPDTEECAGSMGLRKTSLLHP